MSRRRPAYSRHGRRERAGRGRTLAWLVVIVVMVAAAALALTTRSGGGDGAPVAQTSTAPAQKLLIREGLRREDVAAILDEETAIPGSRYLALTAPGPRGRALAKTGRPTSLEGFLFPATYEITDATTAGELVDLQLAAFAANTSGIPRGTHGRAT